MAQEEMDAAAVIAEKDLRENYSEEQIALMAKWWNDHFMTAGHKRLGRVLAKIAKNA